MDMFSWFQESMACAESGGKLGECCGITGEDLTGLATGLR